MNRIDRYKSYLFREITCYKKDCRETVEVVDEVIKFDISGSNEEVLTQLNEKMLPKCFKHGDVKRYLKYYINDLDKKMTYIVTTTFDGDTLNIFNDEILKVLPDGYDYMIFTDGAMRMKPIIDHILQYRNILNDNLDCYAINFLIADLANKSPKNSGLYYQGSENDDLIFLNRYGNEIKKINIKEYEKYLKYSNDYFKYFKKPKLFEFYFSYEINSCLFDKLKNKEVDKSSLDESITLALLKIEDLNTTSYAIADPGLFNKELRSNDNVIFVDKKYKIFKQYSFLKLFKIKRSDFALSIRHYPTIVSKINSNGNYLNDFDIEVKKKEELKENEFYSNSIMNSESNNEIDLFDKYIGININEEKSNINSSLILKNNEELFFSNSYQETEDLILDNESKCNYFISFIDYLKIKFIVKDAYVASLPINKFNAGNFTSFDMNKLRIYLYKDFFLKHQLFSLSEKELTYLGKDCYEMAKIFDAKEKDAFKQLSRKFNANFKEVNDLMNYRLLIISYTRFFKI